MIVGAAACLVLAGCAAGSPVASPTSETTAAVPDNGIELSELGFKNAPDGFSIPEGTRISRAIDQTNAIVLVITEPSADELISYLRTTLPDQGFVITADGNDSLLFEKPGIAGAFTATDDVVGLTLRYDEQS